mmetsp:Transcript_299/g.1023  ORF Transcript_299/g.1023 Transcript_299/m.1023 type:complete len:235 (-) Transcript_299:213-917(-)
MPSNWLKSLASLLWATFDILQRTTKCLSTSSGRKNLLVGNWSTRSIVSSTVLSNNVMSSSPILACSPYDSTAPSAKSNISDMKFRSCFVLVVEGSAYFFCTFFQKAGSFLFAANSFSRCNSLRWNQDCKPVSFKQQVLTKSCSKLWKQLMRNWTTMIFSRRLRVCTAPPTLCGWLASGFAFVECDHNSSMRSKNEGKSFFLVAIASHALTPSRTFWLMSNAIDIRCADDEASMS